MNYTAGSWHDFGGGLAALSGALTGLLFVAVSIRADVLSKSRNLASRAAQTLVLFMTSVLVAIVLTAPQPRTALGAELIAVAAVCGAALFFLDRRAGKSAGGRLAKYLEVASPNMITAVLVGIAGLSFLLELGGGLYWLIPAAVASLAGGVINAWLFLIRAQS